MTMTLYCNDDADYATSKDAYNTQILILMKKNWSDGSQQKVCDNR
jgi:hypothetical protein